MGQYYMVALKREKSGELILNGRKVANPKKGEEPDYIMAKLTEHGWMKNPLCLAVAHELKKGKCRLAWVGDYAEDDTETITKGEVKTKDLWGDNELKHIFPNHKSFKYEGKFLVNHDKKVYIDLTEYIKKSDMDGWVLSPFTLLTAIGNGRGGGDYYDEYPHIKDVGTWAWDSISIKNTPPKGFKKSDIFFKEEAPSK